MKAKIHVCLLKTEKRFWLVLNDATEPPTVLGFKSTRAGLSYFEKAYMKNHSRSYEASMSACVHTIEFQPSIVTFDSVTSLARDLALNGSGAVRISAVSGCYVTVLAKGIAREYWERGEKPKLI